MALAKVKGLLGDLQKLVGRGNSADLAKAGDLIDDIKVEIISFDSLPPLLYSTPNAAEERALAASALEYGALVAVMIEDMELFERNMNQLLPIYTSCPSIPLSPLKRKVQGLNLMFLLVENRLSDFHCVVEGYTPEDLADSQVDFPVKLERELMVGSYDKFHSANAALPDPLYEFFMKSLLSTVRDNVADAMEVSYTTLKASDAQRMLMFDGADEFKEFIGETREDWLYQGSEICFSAMEVGGKTDIPSMRLIGQTLGYATELERIV
ncbi:hypothetical protein TrRE_jg4824 [Triparma retinervis]|uniref:CSN8/PSMD8/EIF3K domain-containing protein n=1 Tax=Triparma retinervis TaxID=2557542 RepID=A0A9W7E9G1_9STRA|nr:hypothetical protein TrRE_jg4824 [Triparma retinervis]